MNREAVATWIERQSTMSVPEYMKVPVAVVVTAGIGFSPLGVPGAIGAAGYVVVDAVVSGAKKVLIRQKKVFVRL